ncbi:MAG: hypothetical protein OJF59_001586 [Cytophagales bacterium]|nr:MAG: hypothetical protein OJF59_001586 [Cytophagales bacterium]
MFLIDSTNSKPIVFYTYLTPLYRFDIFQQNSEIALSILITR